MLGVITVTFALALRRLRIRPAATCDLFVCVRLLELTVDGGVGLYHTFPPPTTRTFLFRTCQASRREPPP